MSVLLKLFITFFKIGLFTFGGGYAMLPLIQNDVLANKWLSESDIINFIAVSESTPGPFAVNIATYVGMEVGGIWGSVCATLGVVLPSFIVILIVAGFYEKFKNNHIVAGCMKGLRPAVIGLILAAMLLMLKSVLFPSGFISSFKSAEFYISIAIFALSAFLILKKKWHPIIILIIAAIIGIISGYAIELL